MKTLTVYTPPVAKARPRIALHGGRAHAYTPRKTEEAEWRIRNEWIDEHGREPMVGPLSLEVVAFVPMPKSIPMKRRSTALPTTRPDGDNYLKTVLDALNQVAWPDDSVVVDMRVRKRYAEDDGPCWVITVDEVPGL